MLQWLITGFALTAKKEPHPELPGVARGGVIMDQLASLVGNVDELVCLIFRRGVISKIDRLNSGFHPSRG